MIVIPRVLSEQLRSADDELRKRLALDFAGHAVGLGRRVADVPAASSAYLDAARAYLDGKEGIGAVVSAYGRFFDAWEANETVRDVLNVVKLAVLVVCQRELERGGVLVRVQWMPDVGDVAAEAQAVAGRWAADADKDDRSAAKRARWEEARWQLIRTIERAPNPAADGPAES